MPDTPQPDSDWDAMRRREEGEARSSTKHTSPHAYADNEADGAAAPINLKTDIGGDAPAPDFKLARGLLYGAIRNLDKGNQEPWAWICNDSTETMTFRWAAARIGKNPDELRRRIEEHIDTPKPEGVGHE